MGEHFAAPLDGFGFEFGVGDDGVDEAHVEGFLGVVLATKEPDFASFLLADDAGEVAGAEAAIEGADFGSGLAEAGVVGGDGEVADDVKDVTASDGVSGDHGDDGFGEGADFLLEVEDVEAGDAVFSDVAGVATDLLVAAGAEGFFAFAGEDDDADGGVFVGEVEGGKELADGLRAEGVADFGPVDGDFGDGAFVSGFVTDVFEFGFGGPAHLWGILTRISKVSMVGGCFFGWDFWDAESQRRERIRRVMVRDVFFEFFAKRLGVGFGGGFDWIPFVRERPCANGVGDGVGS